MKSNNLDFLHLADALPGDIARRKEAGDLDGALRLIRQRLSSGLTPELEPRLRCEEIRLERLPLDYPYDRAAAMDLLRREWPDITDADFDTLVDGGRIDWRYINGTLHCHKGFLDSLRIYPREAPGLTSAPAPDNTARDTLLSQMEHEGKVTARITLRLSLRSTDPAAGKSVMAWLPLPAACPQQSEIEILDATPGGVCAPEDAPQRTIFWESQTADSFSVIVRYLHRAVYTDPTALTTDPVQPDFDTEEQLPHIRFTPYLRALTERVTRNAKGPVEKAAAIYDYITGNVDYRYQPAYLQLDDIADRCARELRGDCGVMALLFITMCRIAGIPARWQSGLAVRPGHVGCHDWAMFYIAPHGWLWADCSFGSSARRLGETDRRRHYFGSLDPWRMVANSAFQAPLTPPDPAWRQDPYDNQRGEMVVDGRGLDDHEMIREQELISFELF